MACIIKSGKEFQQLCNDANIHEDSLEQIVKEWRGNIKERQDAFPSVDEIKEIASPKENFVDDSYLEKATEIWNKKFSRPVVFSNRNDAMAYKLDAERFFATQANYVKITKDGKYEVVVSQPQQTLESIEKEMQSIKDAAIANGTFMKAPNGKDTNLTERQWLQVRTKNFKNWFGDWEKYAKLKSAVVIWGHPASGKTYLFNQGKEDIIDFDSEYKVRLNKMMGLPEGADAKELRKAARKARKQEYHDLIMRLFDEAVEEAKRTGKKLLVSDTMLLIEREADIDTITNMSDAKFIERSAMRGETDAADKMLWKNNINDAMNKVSDKSKIVNTENFLLDDLYGTDVSKVLDENGEPLVVYHGGAPNVEVFKVGSPETTTTGYGTYTEEGTGRKIPVDSARTIFFSSNPFVGQSYAQLYALRYFKDLRHKVQNMIGNLHDDTAGFSNDDFKSFDEFYDFLTIISEYNPRFSKLRDYIKKLQQNGERLKPNEIAAARQLFIDLRSTLEEYTKDWNLSSSEWDNVLTEGRKIIDTYNSLEGAHKLKSGEIPNYIKNEWELYKKINSHREKYNLPKIENYQEIHLFLSSRADYNASDYILKYNGKELMFDDTRNGRDVPVSQMSEQQILNFLKKADISNKASFEEKNNDKVKKTYLEKSGYYPAFLNIRNPFEHDYEGTHMGQGYKQSPKTSFGYVAARQVDKAIRDGNDGVIYRNIYDPYLADNYGVFNPNQIKSAEANIGTFSTEDNNIYHEHEGSPINAGQDKELKNLSKKDNVTVSDLLDLIAEESDLYSVASLLKVKSDLLKDVQVKLREKSSLNTDMYGQRRAYYDADSKTIYINPSANYYNGSSDSVVLHEMMHAITVNRIVGNKQYREQFDKIIDEYNKKFGDSKYRKTNRLGQENTHYMEEFIADVWSNRELINQLKSIESTKKLTLWDKIKNFFTKIFAGSDKTLLADASDAIYRLLDEPEIVRGRDNYYEGERIEIPQREKAFITERMHLDGMTDSQITAMKNQYESVLSYNNKDVYIPYKEWKSMDVDIYDFINNVRQDKSSKSLISRIIKEVTQGWDFEYKDVYDYNKSTKQLKTEQFVVDFINLAKNLGPYIKILADEYGDRYLFSDAIGRSAPYDIVEIISLIISNDITFEELFSKIGGKYYYEDSRQGELFDVDENPRRFVETKKSAEEKSVPQAIRKSNEGYVKQSAKFNREINTLLDGSIVSPTEARQTAIDIAFFMHDAISKFHQDPKLIFNEPAFGKDANDNTEDKIKEIKAMSRKQLVQYLGIANLINYTKNTMFTPSDEWTLEMFKQAELYRNSMDALIKLGMTTFASIEEFGLISNSATDNVSIESGSQDYITVDSLNIDPDNYTETANYEEVLGELGNLQEHWQIESRSLDVLQNATALVKEALASCLIKKPENIYNEQTGKEETQYVNVKSKWGVDTRVDARDATSSILRWTRGALDLNSMIVKLKEKQNDNTWIQQIVQRLEDKSGDNADFQSQFFKVFEKHFQKYSVGQWDSKKGKYVSKIVNENSALKEARNSVKTAFNSGEAPIFFGKRVNQHVLGDMIKMWQDALAERNKSYENADIEKASRIISLFMNNLGYNASPEMVLAAINKTTLNSMVDAMGYIVSYLKDGLKNESYDPLEPMGANSIYGNVGTLLTPVTNLLEDTRISSFSDGGKTYQGYVTPSYLTKMMIKFQSDKDDFDTFIKTEYGEEDWFRDKSKDYETSSWRCPWLLTLSSLDPELRQKIFAHKVQLNFNKKNYMRGMNYNEYIMSFLAEYFSETTIDNTPVAWYRIPMMSNKPSSEFIRFIRYSDADYKNSILKDFHKIFAQELSRIQTVMMMDEQQSAVDLDVFRKNGKNFQFLSFLNAERKNGTELGKLIDSKIAGNKVDENRLKKLFYEATRTFMDNRSKEIISNWKNQGLFEHLDEIDGLHRDFNNNEEALTNFIWNDTLASMNILELTVTDIALYKHAEDLQKRLAQLHSPGLRGNASATDFKGNSVTGDGTIKSIVIKDYKKLTSNIIDNLNIIYNKKIDAARKIGDEQSAKGWEAVRDDIVGQFTDSINVTDGQAYSSLTSARKKGFIFGTWNRENEELYNKIKHGPYTYTDVKNALTQPRKPFVYSTISKSLDVNGAPMSTVRKGVQYKNSEYLLILADAIMRDEDTGQANLLKAIFDFMEESEKRNPGNGIDTVMFDSCVKTGLGNVLDINQFIFDNENGTERATNYLLENTFIEGTNNYNELFVDRVKIEDYSEQQEIPEHFKEHEQAHGSQVRYIIPSDLMYSDEYGNPVYYQYNDNGAIKNATADEFRKDYENTIAQNIQEDIDEIKQEFGIDNYFMSNADKNVAISKMLQREILSSPRYGIDLLQACAVDESGEFAIPLNDPIQSKRIEQLLNSVIKNRINKQKLPGGPVVQVSNFGTSHKLNIVFNENGGIAYYEAYAPIFSDDLLRFCDKNGFIDIKAIEQVNPDLLKMIGYRIPSEDKYSVFPIKIVGFLPREAGDALMLPYEITTVTGADFDIDKIYLIKKNINLTKPFDDALKSELNTNFKNEESKKEYLTERHKRLKSQLISVLPEDILTEEDKVEIAKLVSEQRYTYKDKDGNEKEVTPIDDMLKEEDDKYNSIVADKKSKYSGDRLEKSLAKSKDIHERQIAHIEEIRAKRYAQRLEYKNKEKKNEVVRVYLQGDRLADTSDPIISALKNKYISTVYGTSVKSSGRQYRNNKIFDMSWSVLTNPTSADKMLNPGGFDKFKILGYAITAYKQGVKKENGQEYTLEELIAINDSDRLKDLCYTDKNLCFIDTHTQFYRQNAVAGQILGIFAVAKVAHTILQGYDYAINVEDALNLKGNVNIMGHSIGGIMTLDSMYNSNGEIISKVLGSLVAASADAVKDPILNLMNINNDTVNVLNIAIRLGIPFEDIATLLSSRAITDLLEYYNSKKLNGDIRLNDVIKDYLKAYEKKYNIKKDSKLPYESLTKEEVVKNVKGKTEDSVTYKILKAYQRLSAIAYEVSGLDSITRLNSITNAVGPLIVDNLVLENKLDRFSVNICKKVNSYSYNGNVVNIGDTINIDGKNVVVDENTIKWLSSAGVIKPEHSVATQITEQDVFEDHPILDKFRTTQDIARELMSEFPAYSESFNTCLHSIGENTLRKLMTKDGRKTLSALADFYQSYMLLASGAINQDNLKYFIDVFPSEFYKGGWKQKYSNNPFISAIRTKASESSDGKVKTYLEIPIDGLDQQQKEKLMVGWAQLQKDNPTLSSRLFEYAFFRGGLGFSPKTFMSLAPIQVKKGFTGYVETFRHLPQVVESTISEQFVRNNANNRLIVNVINDQRGIKKIDDNRFFVSNYNLIRNEYFKLSDDPNAIIFKRLDVDFDNNTATYQKLSPLGNNGEYFEAFVEKKQQPLNNNAVQSQESTENGVEGMNSNFDGQEPVVEAETQRLLDLLFTVDAQEKHKSYNEDVKNDPHQKELYMNYFKEQLANRGIAFNESIVEKMYELFC